MTQFLDDEQLQTMTVPTVELSHHRVQLKHVLVSAAEQKHAAKQLIPQGWKQYMTTKQLLTSVSVAGVLAIAVLTFSTMTSPVSVSAHELARNTSQAVNQLTLEQRHELTAHHEKYAPLLLSWIAKAEQASDLRVLSYAELERTYPNMTQDLTSQDPHKDFLMTLKDPNADDTTTVNVRTLRYLEFTLVEDRGLVRKVVVGVNHHNLPEAFLTTIVVPGQPGGGA